MNIYTPIVKHLFSYIASDWKCPFRRFLLITYVAKWIRKVSITENLVSKEKT